MYPHSPDFLQPDSEKSSQKKESLDPPKKNISLLLDIFSYYDDFSPQETVAKIRQLSEQLRQHPVPTEWESTKEQVLTALSVAYNRTILALKKEFLQQNPGKKVSDPLFRIHIDQFFHSTYIHEFSALFPLQEFKKLLRLNDTVITPETFALPQFRLQWAAILLCVFIGFGIVGDTHAQEKIAELSYSDQERPPTPREDEPQSFLNIGYELGQKGTPYLLWPLKNQPDKRENIFEDFFTTGQEESGKWRTDVGPIFEKYDISLRNAHNLLTGYTFGLWSTPAQKYTVFSSDVEIIIAEDDQELIRLCGGVATACHLEAEKDSVFANDPAGLLSDPHENGHGRFNSELFLVPDGAENIYQFGNVTVHLTRNREAKPGIVLSNEAGEVGVLDLERIWEAMAEIVEDSTLETMGDYVPDDFYANEYNQFFNSEVYTALVEQLAHDQTFRRDLTTALNSRDLMSFYQLLGKFMIENFPEYPEQVLAAAESNPELMQNSLLFFNLSRYETVTLLRELPPETRAGFILAAEWGSLIHNSSVSNSNFSSGQVTLVAEVGNGKVTYRNQLISEIVEGDIGINKELASRREYAWGDGMEQVGQEQAFIWLDQFETTGHVPVSQEFPHKIVAAATFEALMESKHLTLSSTEQASFAEIVNNLEILILEEEAVDPSVLPYTISQQVKEQKYAGIFVSKTTLTSLVRTTRERWIQDTFWTFYRAILEKKWPRETYRVFPYLTQNGFLMEYVEPRNEKTILLQLGMTEGDEYAHLTLLNTTGIPDLLSFAMMQATGPKTLEELSSLFGPELAQHVLEMRNDVGVFEWNLGVSMQGNAGMINALFRTSEHSDFLSNWDSVTLAHPILNDPAFQNRLPWFKYGSIYQQDNFLTQDAFSAAVNQASENTQNGNKTSWTKAWDMFYLIGINGHISSFLFGF